MALRCVFMNCVACLSYQSPRLSVSSWMALTDGNHRFYIIGRFY